MRVTPDEFKKDKESKRHKIMHAVLPNQLKRVMVQRPKPSQPLEVNTLQRSMTPQAMEGAKVLFNDDELLDGFVLIDVNPQSASSSAHLPKAVRKVENFLKEGGFDCHHLAKPNADGETPLTLAIAQQKPLSLIKRLIRADAYVNQTNALGFSPLQLATITNNPDLARLLIKNHADFNEIVDIESRDGHHYYRRIEQCLPELTGKANPKNKAWAKFAKDLEKLKANRSHYIAPPPVVNLVFEGGGAKGTVYVGALKVLEENGVLQGVKRVAGSSAGGITSLLVALGYSADEIEAEMNAMDFTKFMDGGGFFSKLYNMFWDNRHGVHKGDTFYQWAQEKIAAKLGQPDATFADLQKAAQTNPKLKELFLTGTNLTTGLTEVFGAERTPKMKLADAVRITMSFPGAFQAVPITDENGVTHYYADGGIRENYPMYIFDDAKYLPQGYGHNAQGVNPGTLGFKVDSSKECAEMRWHQPKANDNKGVGVFGWLSRLVGAVQMSPDERVRHQYATNTVQIDDTGVDTLNFALTPEEKRRMVESGAKETANFLKLYHGQDVFYGQEDKLGTAVAPRPELDRRMTKADLERLRAQLARERAFLVPQDLHYHQKRHELNGRLAQIDGFLGADVQPLTRSVVFGSLCHEEARLDDDALTTSVLRATPVF